VGRGEEERGRIGEEVMERMGEGEIQRIRL